MIRLLRSLLIACPLALALAGCAKTAPAPGGLGDVCIDNKDCASGFVCAAGKCVLPANLGGCEASRLRCNGSDVEQCDAGGVGWTLVSSCATGCSGGACRPQACAPGARRCEGDAAEACTPAGDAWALVQVCPSHCDPATGQCKAPVCTPFAVRCDPSGANTVQTCDSFGASWSGSACATGTICDSGRCAGAICAPAATRCSDSGGAVETCNALGDSFKATSSCAFGCAASASGAACAPAACASTDTRCDGSAVEHCRPDQTGWAFVSFCASGCTAPSGATPAQCAPPVCAPSARRCSADASGIEVCASDGSGWTRVDSCPQGCAGGQCTTTSAGCQPGDQRCNGNDAQVCGQASPGVTQWTTQATCLTGCSSGACAPGGSCVSVNLKSAATSVPIDGVSTALLYSDVIQGAGNTIMPDGTEFTVQLAAPGTTFTAQQLQQMIASSDADGSVPGTQVKSIGGRVHFTLRAPASVAPFTATATATLTQGPSCTGSTPVSFTASDGSSVLVAEDFSSQRLRNVAQTTADWNASREALAANWPTSAGAGEDGQLCVYAGGPAPDPSWGCATWQSGAVNLSGSYAASFAVLGLTAQGATVDRPALSLSGGDEVILWDVQGSSAGWQNAGSYELLHVRSVNGSAVSFVEQVRGTYGALSDQNVSAQHVVLQRIPHFSKLVVLQGGTVTADAWDGARGGLLALRTLTGTVLGDLSMDAAGFRGGPNGAPYFGEDATSPVSAAINQQTPGAGAGYYSGSAGYGTAASVTATYCTPSACYPAGQSYGLPLLGRLFLGSGGGGGASNSAGGRGGGAIILAAQSLTLASATNVFTGKIHADGASSAAGSGSGGSLWLSAPSLALGTGSAGAVTVRGGGSGKAGDGRLRVDYQQFDAGPPACSRLLSTCNAGQSGPLVAQSLDAYTAPAQQTIKQATLSLALGAPQGAIFQAAASLADPPDFATVPASAAGPCPASTVCFNSSGSPAQGPRFRWKAQLFATPDVEQTVQGLQWSLKVQ